MRIAGVDPGCYGAIGLLAHGRIEAVYDMPILKIRRGKTDKAEVDGYRLAEILRMLRADKAFIEQVGGIQGQSASAAFNFGRAAGAVEYAFKAFGVPVFMIAPVVWKKDMRVGKGKDAARATAKSLWPVSMSHFRRKKDDGRAESCLVAEWGRRRDLGRGNDVFG